MKKNIVLQYPLLLFKGVIVGFGAIMPGISGGTLCVAFGMYKPLLGLLNHPFQTIKSDWQKLLFFILGGGIGFVGLSGLAGWLMEKNSQAVTCALIGFIIGTFPGLWKSAGLHGRKPSSYISMLSGFIILLVILIALRCANGVAIAPGVGSFLLCGITWGISFIVPGLSSSTLLLFFGLYQPMLEGISSFSLPVLIPLAIGVGVSLLTLSKLVDSAYHKWYSQVSHSIIGFVAASIIMIIPVGMFKTVSGFALGTVCIVGGSIISFFTDNLCTHLKKSNQ